MTVKYRLAELRSSVIKKGTSYIGQIVHNHTLDMDGMVRRYAEKYGLTTSQALFNLKSVTEYIESEIEEGNRLRFDRFSISLKMKGRFTSANAPYSAKDNPICVVMTPSPALQAAAAKLEPVCESVRSRPRISTILHHKMNPGEENLPGVIRLNGGLTTMNAYHCKVDQTREDEGVWLTSLDGQFLLKAAIRENTEVTCDVVFPESSLPGGVYRVEIRSRGNPENPIVSAIRKVTVLS